MIFNHLRKLHYLIKIAPSQNGSTTYLWAWYCFNFLHFFLRSLHPILMKMFFVIHHTFHSFFPLLWNPYLKTDGALMPFYHFYKPVFRPKMAIFQRAGMREGERVATPTSFSIFDFYDMKSLWFKFGHDIFAGFKMARL